MPQQTKIFRVFVSSTFTDMKEERRILQKDVFPRLEKFCESKGAKFQAVDLRWGVNEESQRNQKTLDICLNEITRCQRMSPKPNFLILLGNKYGWQPVPTKIPNDEMDQILSKLPEVIEQVIKNWYRLDKNAIPPEYVLQPREGELAVYDNWKTEETEIRYILRYAVSNLNFSEKQRVKYFTSATHQEIINGALNPPEDTENPKEHVLAMIRETEGMPQDKSAEKFIDILNGQIDDKSKEKLDSLKSDLEEKLGNNYLTYPAKWENDKTKISDEKEFIKKVYGFLEKIIQDQIDKIISPDELEREKKLHNEFKDKLNLHFHGRDEILSNIKTYLSDQKRKVFTMIGESGSGKSSVMANAILNAQSENTNAVTVFRFIGVTSSSSNIVSLLQSICGQIARELNTDLETIAGPGNDKALYELNGLTEIFKKCLDRGTAERPIVLFLDALDQLSDTDNARALNWLPRELPENSKLVESSLPELEGKLNHTSIEHLPLLPTEEAEKVLGKWFEAISRTLTPKQHSEIIDKFNKSGQKPSDENSKSNEATEKSGLPIYLKIAFEKAKQWHSYDKDVSLKKGVDGIIDDFIDGLISDGHDSGFVEHVICYMLCGRYQGLAENEILEILVFDEEYWKNLVEKKTHEDHREELKEINRFPVVIWSRFFLDLEPFLTERDADGVPIITFFHRQFVEVLQEKYKLIEKKLETEQKPD